MQQKGEFKMINFIHLSDLHIHKNKKNKDNLNCIKIVDFIINKYTGEEQENKVYDNNEIYDKIKPLILITGDITDDGDEEQYEIAVSILENLTKKGFKILAVPGNHDYGTIGNIYTEKSQSLFQEYILSNLMNNSEAQNSENSMEDIFPIVNTIKNENSKPIVFIGIDSVVGNEDELLHFARGEVGKPQRIKLNKEIKNAIALDAKIVVYFHHHPFYRNFFKRLVLEMDDGKRY